ncbi:MAG: hypothetical protein ACRDTC_17920 [Pseudonocardiaceae bacterium]
MSDGTVGWRGRASAISGATPDHQITGEVLSYVVRLTEPLPAGGELPPCSRRAVSRVDVLG